MDDVLVEIPKVPIRPVDCLVDAKNLLTGNYWLFVGTCAVAVLVGSAVPMGILMGPMMCGMYLCYFKLLRREQVAFSLLFKGFDYFVESLIATLILVGAMLVVLVPLYLALIGGFFFAAAGAPGNERVFWGLFIALGVFYLVALLLGVIAGTLFCFVYPLIVDRGMRAVPALQTSAQAALSNLGGVLGLIILVHLISLLAGLCCYLPMFLVLPINVGAIAIAYRKVFPDVALP